MPKMNTNTLYIYEEDTQSPFLKHKTFSREESKEILTNITLGKYNASQMAAFMAAYCMRSITVEELEGFRDGMLELCLKTDLSEYELIDLCGTGGDGKDTFNISTLASFVVAGAGYKVSKHGNYGVSSGCGSSNVMEYLGYKFRNDIDHLKRSLLCRNLFFTCSAFSCCNENGCSYPQGTGCENLF